MLKQLFRLDNIETCAPARIKAAVDRVSSNIMVADSNHTIVYANDSVLAMLKAAEKDIKKELPRFDTASVVGASIDIFHKNPPHQRAMLDTLSGTYKASITVGGHIFDLIANPFTAKNGERLGTVVEWLDATELRAAESRATRIQTSVDRISSNVMIADEKNIIIYMNEAVTAMLRKSEEEIQKQLPWFTPDSIVGQSFDRFHQNPAHQREAVGRMTSTLKSTIQIGDAVFNLVANPLFDKDGKRLGTAVEWIDDTSKAQLEAIGRSMAVVEYKMDGTVVSANANFLNTLGYTLEEIKGKHQSMFVTPAEKSSDEYKQLWEALSEVSTSRQSTGALAKGEKMCGSRRLITRS